MKVIKGSGLIVFSGLCVFVDMKGACIVILFSASYYSINYVVFTQSKLLK